VKDLDEAITPKTRERDEASRIFWAAFYNPMPLRLPLSGDATRARTMASPHGFTPYSGAGCVMIYPCRTCLLLYPATVGIWYDPRVPHGEGS
jgi:hypothetical protein